MCVELIYYDKCADEQECYNYVYEFVSNLKMHKIMKYYSVSHSHSITICYWLHIHIKITWILIIKSMIFYYPEINALKLIYYNKYVDFITPLQTLSFSLSLGSKSTNICVPVFSIALQNIGVNCAI